MKSLSWWQTLCVQLIWNRSLVKRAVVCIRSAYVYNATVGKGTVDQPLRVGKVLRVRRGVGILEGQVVAR